MNAFLELSADILFAVIGTILLVAAVARFAVANDAAARQERRDVRAEAAAPVGVVVSTRAREADATLMSMSGRVSAPASGR